MIKLILSRRNLLVLLSKLDRQAAGEETACTIVKQSTTGGDVQVTAMEDSIVYANRQPGVMLEVDEPK